MTFFERYLEFTKNHEATRRIHIWTAISIVAAALERKVWIDRGYFRLFPNLYVFIIGASGVVRKSTATGVGVDLAREVGLRMISEKISAASLIQQMASASSPFANQGKMELQSPLFCYASELSVFIDSMSHGLTELLTTFYDGGPNNAAKPWVSETRALGRVEIHGPCLNMLGASTPTWLRKSIRPNDMQGGFASRVIFVVERSVPKTLVAWPELGNDGQQLRENLIDDLRRIHSLTGAMEVTPAARDLFRRWYEFHMRESLPQNTDARFNGYYARKGDMLLKLAVIASVAEDSSLQLREEHLQWAGDELEHLEADMMSAFQETGSSPELPIHKVLQFIEATGGCAEAQIFAAFGRRGEFSKAEITRTITELHEMDEIELKDSYLGDRLIRVWRKRRAGTFSEPPLGSAGGSGAGRL